MVKNKQPMLSNRVNNKSGHNKFNTGNSFGLLAQLGDDAATLPNRLVNNNGDINEHALPKPKVGPGRPRADPLAKVSDPAVR